MPNGQNIFLVDSDVAITIEEEAGIHAEAKLKVASILSIGGGETANKNSATNHINFKVSLAIPVDLITEEDLKKREVDQSRRNQEAMDRMNNENNFI